MAGFRIDMFVGIGLAGCIGAATGAGMAGAAGVGAGVAAGCDADEPIF